MASRAPPSLGSVTTSERFQRLAWGAGTGGLAGYEYGVLAGGMVDGSIKIFNPAKIVAGLAEEALVAPSVLRARSSWSWTERTTAVLATIMTATIMTAAAPPRPARPHC
jgi:hypothetical protein